MHSLRPRDRYDSSNMFTSMYVWVYVCLSFCVSEFGEHVMHTAKWCNSDVRRPEERKCKIRVCERGAGFFLFVLLFRTEFLLSSQMVRKLWCRIWWRLWWSLRRKWKTRDVRAGKKVINFPSSLFPSNRCFRETSFYSNSSSSSEVFCVCLPSSQVYRSRRGETMVSRRKKR